MSISLILTSPFRVNWTPLDEFEYLLRASIDREEAAVPHGLGDFNAPVVGNDDRGHEAPESRPIPPRMLQRVIEIVVYGDAFSPLS